MRIPSTGGEYMDRYRTHMSRYDNFLYHPQTCADVTVAKDCQIRSRSRSRGSLQGSGEARRKTYHRDPAQSRLSCTSPQNGRKQHLSQINTSILSRHQYAEEIRLKVWGKEEPDGWRPLQIICKDEAKDKRRRQVSRVNPCANR
jgi:hypothetical protein